MAKSILGQSPATTNPTLEVAITAAIEGDYQSRCVFPELRLANAKRLISRTTGSYEIDVRLAEELLRDAQERYQAIGRGREFNGMRCAFAALTKKLRLEIKRAKGLWDDPGPPEAVQRMNDCLVRFKIGDHVRGPDGQRMVIVGKHGTYRTYANEGPYVEHESGRRVAYRHGYLAKEVATGEEFFWPPYLIEALDDECSYLRLVVNNSPTSRLDDLCKLGGQVAHSRPSTDGGEGRNA